MHSSAYASLACSIVLCATPGSLNLKLGTHSSAKCVALGVLRRGLRSRQCTRCRRAGASTLGWTRPSAPMCGWPARARPRSPCWRPRARRLPADPPAPIARAPSPGRRPLRASCRCGHMLAHARTRPHASSRRQAAENTQEAQLSRPESARKQRSHRTLSAVSVVISITDDSAVKREEGVVVKRADSSAAGTGAAGGSGEGNAEQRVAGCQSHAARNAGGARAGCRAQHPPVPL